MCHKPGLKLTRRGETCGIVQSRASLAIEKELAEKYNIGMHTPVTGDVIERFMSESCWERVEDLLKAENMPSTSQATLLKRVLLAQAFRYHSFHEWIFHMPRLNSRYPPPGPFSRLDVT